MPKLLGKVAIIAGGGTGMGATGAKLFAKEGAKVVIFDIRDKEAEETVEAIKKAGGEATFIHCDLSKTENIEKAIHTAAARYGKINIYWHNAGVAGGGPLLMLKEKDYDLVLNINLKAAVFGSKFVIPELRKAGGGAILYTSSSLGLVPSMTPDYSCSKAGVCMLVRVMTICFAREGIRTNSIAPGAVPTTPMWHEFFEWNKEAMVSSRWTKINEDMQKMVANQMPMGKLGEEIDMAKAALFLCSDYAKYITGVNLPVEGGNVAK